MKNSQQLPEIGSLWMDADEGGDYLYQYKGIEKRGTFKGRLRFVRFDYKTNTASKSGGLYIGESRFKTDMVSAGKLAAQPCCGAPTLFPMLWCDDCGYEVWSKARKEKAA